MLCIDYDGDIDDEESENDVMINMGVIMIYDEKMDAADFFRTKIYFNSSWRLYIWYLRACQEMVLVEERIVWYQHG